MLQQLVCHLTKPQSKNTTNVDHVTIGNIIIEEIKWNMENGRSLSEVNNELNYVKLVVHIIPGSVATKLFMYFLL